MRTRRSFIKTSAGALALTSMSPGSLWAADADSFREFGLRATAKLKPRPSARIVASSLSVGFETLDRQFFDPLKTFPHLAQLGVKWARCQTGWARTETTRGQYDFAWLDQVVDGLLKIGIQPWFNFGYGNPLYTPQADKTAVGWVPIFSEEAMEGWKRFTAKIAEHFRDRVRHYEIWNEPNLTGFWKPGKTEPARYVELVKQTAPIIRQQVPDATIIGGSLARMPQDFLQKCLAAGLAEHVDKLSYHPYREIPEKDYESDVKAFRGLLAQHGGARVKLWQGECGCPSKPGGSGALSKTDWNETRQAKWLLRRIMSDLQFEIELTSYFLIVDLIGYGGSTNWKGLLRGADYTPKPAFHAYQNLCALFDADTRKTDLPIKVEGPDIPSLRTVTFTRPSQPVYVYWRPADLVKDEPSRKVRVTIGDKALPLAKPILLDLLNGQYYEIGGAKRVGDTWQFDSLPLADYPLCITSLS
jgi:polysaccharide biosynthesis protein PslG